MDRQTERETQKGPTAAKVALLAFLRGVDDEQNSHLLEGSALSLAPTHARKTTIKINSGMRVRPAQHRRLRRLFATRDRHNVIMF